MATAGETFAKAVAAQDAIALRAILADTIDFQGLTPRRHFQVSSAANAVDDVILGIWFARAQVDELCEVSTSQVADRQHVTYRVRVHRDGQEHLVEQQAYYDLNSDGRICWMRVLCSGYQPV